MFSTLGLPELVVILLIVVLLFCVGRVSNVGKELGSANGSIRKGMNEDQDKKDTDETGQGTKV